MTIPVTPWPMVSTVVRTGGLAVEAAYGPMLGGGYIVNPASALDQGLAVAETLYVDLVGPATPYESGTTRPVQPGYPFAIPAGFDGVVSVNAVSPGHRFSGIVLHEPANYQPPTGPFPPAGPTTMTGVIPSYLYLEYNDDEDLQAFVETYNAMVQQYISWFATILLPVYSSPTVAGSLLDWVAAGLYGMLRPALSSGITQNLGMLNTIALNTLPLNVEEIVGPSDYFITSDDVFKRILAWHILKGDGKLFNVRWLKRRVIRFLTVADGGAFPVNQTYPISVTFGVGNQVNINLQSTLRYANGGAIVGAGMLNDFMPNEFETTSVSVPVSPLVPVFKAAVEAGILELPFQFDWVVNVN